MPWHRKPLTREGSSRVEVFSHSTGRTQEEDRSGDDVVTKGGTAREARRLSARPAAIATGTSVTIATATPDTRERCHNDKPCAARRYGGPEPGNRCERFASRGAERSRVRETRISRSQKQGSPLHPPLIEIERAFESVFWCRARNELFCVVLFLVALCFCSPAPRFSSVYYVDAFLSFRYESFVVWYENDSCLLLRGSPRFVIIARLSVPDIVLNCCFRGFFRRRDNA